MNQRIFITAAMLCSALGAGQALATPGGPCATPLFSSGAGPMDHTNHVTLVVDRSTFPTDLWDDVDASLTAALLDWNQSCETPPPANDYPVFSKTNAPYNLPEGSVGEKTVSVVFGTGFGPGESCQQFSNQMCYPLATTDFKDGKVVVTVWEWSGRTGNTYKVDYGNMAHFDWILKHELGHVLGLADEDPQLCFGSVMVDNYQSMILQDQGAIYRDVHCPVLQTIHTPPDPLGDAEKYNDPKACDSLHLYCDPVSGGFFSPWPKIRSRCIWVPDVQTVVTTVSNWGDSTRQVIRYMKLECFWSFSWLEGGDPPTGHETIRAPTIVIALPNDLQVATGSVLRVAGWAWANTNPMRQLVFWIDGEEVPADKVNVTTGLFKPEMCQLGIDPGTCNPNSAFEGTINVAYLNPGRHFLQVVATDENPDPMPNYNQIEFVVPSTTPNQSPVAINDSAIASIGIGSTHPITIPVVNNDSDPEGWPLQLPGNPFVTYPSKGLVRRLSDGTIEYTPLPNSSGSDSFQYKVEDSFGLPATATVNISIMEGMFLP